VGYLVSKQLMCGISGRIHLDGAPVVAQAIERMNAVQWHRGPDDEGVWVRDNVGLGARRLAILDLSRDGHMPMQAEDGRAVVVFNGEIYNYPHLRRRLEGQGVRFRSRCDTEVILHLYERYGDRCIRELHGMFAFGLWDVPRRRLLLARDRLGKKPLHFRHSGAVFAFASEIKAILTDGEFARRPEPGAVRDFLVKRYVSGVQTAFQEISRIAPGSFAVLEDGRLRHERYWEPHFVPKLNLSLEEAERRLLELMDEATKARLLSDVPVGAFLSGGVDSAAIVDSMIRAGASPVRTFSIGFDDSAFNEAPRARATATAFGTEHHEMIVRPDAAQVLPRIIYLTDEPFADTSAVPTYYLSEFARRHVTVALNGDGGDEAFGGYERYAAFRLATRIRDVALPVVPWLADAAALIPTGRHLRSRRSRVRRFFDGVAQADSARYLAWTAVFTPHQLDEMATDGFRQSDDDAEGTALRDIDDLLAFDYANYLPGDLLVKMDRMSMGHSLEARSPFLDHAIVEFAAGLPSNWKVRGMTGKWILRRALRHRLPRHVWTARKSGFGVPVQEWMRTQLHGVARRYLLAERADRGYLRPAAVKQMLDEHRDGIADHGQHLWSLLTLELWHRLFIDTSVLEQPSAHVTLDAVS
jgi:asparagine synthase (glutamine-hydrolysing)